MPCSPCFGDAFLLLFVVCFFHKAISPYCSIVGYHDESEERLVAVQTKRSLRGWEIEDNLNLKKRKMT